MSSPVTGGTFRSLRNRNYRLWAIGALVSNIGTMMQRTAQDWLVLTQLTDRNATAVGVVMALQYGPMLLLLPWAGSAADRFDQRKLLYATQAAMGVLALVQGVLTITHCVQLWQVYVLAFLSGCAAAFDAPVRQTFVAELVGDDDLPNAIALNTTSFTAAGLLGPAVAGIVIASIGTGWAFAANGVSFLAVMASLFWLRIDQLHPREHPGRERGGFVEGFRYVWANPELKATLLMLFLIGTFGLNMPIFVSTMAVQVFHADARGYGLLNSILALGTIAGALYAAGRGKPRFRTLLLSAAVLGIGFACAAFTPNYWLFGAALVVVGIAVVTFTNATNSLMQLSSEPAMRGRVMALRVGVALGGTPLGAPTVGWVANHLGPRWSLGVGALSGFVSALVALHVLRKHKQAAHVA